MWGVLAILPTAAQSSPVISPVTADIAQPLTRWHHGRYQMVWGLTVIEGAVPWQIQQERGRSLWSLSSAGVEHSDCCKHWDLEEKTMSEY